MRKYYDVHGFKFSVGGEAKKKIEFLDKVYAYFRTKPCEEDLVVTLGQEGKVWSWSNLGGQEIDKKYIVGERMVYLKDSHKISSWKGLVDFHEPLRVFADGNEFFSERFIWRFVIEPPLLFGLAKRGFAFAHASAVGQKLVHLLPASRGVGKTSTSLSLARKGYKFYGDEYVLLKGAKAYNYPTSIRLLGYNLRNCSFLKEKLTLEERLEVFIKNTGYKLSLGWGQLPFDAPVKKVVPEIGTSGKIGSVIFLTQTNNSKISSRELTKADTVRKLLVLNKLEINKFNEVFLALQYNNPDLECFWELIRENLSKLKADYYELLLPKHYDQREINQLVEKLIKKSE